MHVWAIDTPANRGAAEQVWTRRRAIQSELGMTVFLFDDVGPDVIVARELEAIDLHHDERSQVAPWARALVYGASATPLLVEELRRFGFDVFSETAGGFVTSRSLDAG